MSTLTEAWSSQAPLVLDGGIGTELMARAEGRWTTQAELPAIGELEAFNLDRPDTVEAVHRAYAEAGAVVLSTNTFGALDMLGATGTKTARKAQRSLLGAGVQRARACADSSSTPRFVLGSIGPGRRSLTRGDVESRTLARDLELSIDTLLEAGVDGLLFETAVERAALELALEVAGRAGANSIVVALAVDAAGRMLDGTRVPDLAASLPTTVEVLALNCTTGFDSAVAGLAELRAVTERPLGWWPNAGLPQREEGRMLWPVQPGEYADVLAAATRRFGLSLVGGCCGTTPGHIAGLVNALARNLG